LKKVLTSRSVSQEGLFVKKQRSKISWHSSLNSCEFLNFFLSAFNLKDCTLHTGF
jgi:hypothetical protein